MAEWDELFSGRVPQLCRQAAEHKPTSVGLISMTLCQPSHVLQAKRT